MQTSADLDEGGKARSDKTTLPREGHRHVAVLPEITRSHGGGGRGGSK